MNYYQSGSSTPINWGSLIEQFVRGYETGEAKGLVHGLQKDAIQNTWGARATNKGKDWKTIFTLVDNEKGCFLLIQDLGTTGMTGPNLSTEEIKNFTKEIPDNYKLARFSAMNYSGGNQGAGLFGRGKILFSAASKNNSILYETYTQEEGYRANWKKLIGNDLKVRQKALEGQEAQNLIYSTIGIQPIEEIGSRIIIENPLEDIINSFIDGSFIKAIEETWWRIILKYNAKIIVVFNNNRIKAEVPSEYKEALSNRSKWKSWNKTIISIPEYYKVKNIQLFASPNEIDEDLREVCVYRKDMKIGRIPLDIPAKIKKKYFGIVEVDKDWENELEKIESLEHYGFSNKRKGAFQQLKNFVSKEHDDFMREIGLISNRSNQHEELINEMTQISRYLNDFLGKMDIDRIGSGRNKSVIEARIMSVDFPNKCNNRVETDDVIKNIRYKISNNSGMRKTIKYKLVIKCDNEEILEIKNKESQIQPSSEIFIGPFNITIKDTLIKYRKHTIELTITREGIKDKIVKLIPFYYAIDPHTKEDNKFLIKNKSIKFPHKDTNRINTNEKIENIMYTIENNSYSKAYIAFHLTTLNAENRYDMIEDIMMKRDIILDPYSAIDIMCKDIEFTEGKYINKLESGVIEIRARISAAKDFEGYEISEELSQASKIKVFFNREEDKGVSLFQSIGAIKDYDSYKRSFLDGDNRGWIFNLNISHPSYRNIQDDPDMRREYIQEEMLKQTLMVFLKLDNYSIFDKDKNWFQSEDLSNADLAEQVYTACDKLIYNRYKVG